MPFRIYKGGSELSKGEREILSSLASILSQHYTNSSDFCYLFVGYYCEGIQFDATVVRSDAVVNVEVKDMKVDGIIATHQGDLINKPSLKSVHNGRGETPLAQIKNQNYALKNFVFKNQSELLGGKVFSSAKDFDNSGFILFRNLQKYDTSKLDPSTQVYFKVTDIGKFWDEFSRYRGRDFTKKGLPLNLEEDFVKRLATLLALEPITIEELSKNIVDDEFEKLLSQYFREIAERYKPSRDYIDRQSLEGALLNDKNHIIIGAPGAGKSWLLKRMMAAHAEEVVRKSSFKRIPCLLEMSRDGDSNYIEIIALTIMESPDPDIVEVKLRSGDFWIVFDDVDRMQDFRINLPKIINFIKLYPNNRYSLSICREKYNDPDSKDEFEKLLKMRYHYFEEIRVEQFTKDEWDKYIERELPTINPEQKKDLKIFISKLPDTNPLTLKRVRDIFLDSVDTSKKLVYENEGKFYDTYFQLRLEQECKKGGLGKGANITLGNILTELGRISFEQSKGSFLLEDVMEVIRDERADEPTRYYELLLKAEILKLGEQTVRDVKHKSDEVVQFDHFLYRDFFVAKYMVGECEDEDFREKFILNNNEHQSIIFLCGIESNRDIVLSIITMILEKRNLNRVDLAVHCFCNTFHKLAGLSQRITDVIIAESRRDKYFLKYNVFEYLKSYGYRIYTNEIQEYFEYETQYDDILKIDWVVLKSLHPIFGDFDERYKKTPRYVYKFDSAKGKYIESCSRLANKVASQNLDGYNFFLKLKDIHSVEELLDLALDESYNSFFRSELLWDIRNECRERRLNGKYVLSKIKKFSETWNSQCEEFRWEAIPFYIYLDELNDEHEISPAERESIENELIEMFWKENSGPVQLRILISNYFPYRRSAEFYEDILSHYSNDSVVDLQRLALIWEEEFFNEVDWAINTHDEDYPPFIAHYNLSAFKNETYSTLIKCVTMEYAYYFYSKHLKAIDSHFKKILVQYSFSENEKLRTVAEWALGNILRDEKPE